MAGSGADGAEVEQGVFEGTGSAGISRMSVDAQEAVFRDGAGGDRRVRMGLQPGAGGGMEFVVGIHARDQDVDVEEQAHGRKRPVKPRMDANGRE